MAVSLPTCGTYALLSDSEKQRVKGFIINRFRGDVDLLTPGIDWLEQKTGIPTLAVIPAHKLYIEAEDSISQRHTPSQKDDTLYISSCRFIRAPVTIPIWMLSLTIRQLTATVRDPEAFNGADIIVLPGSKHVRGDLQWLKDGGWLAIIQRHYRFGGGIISICGGYQMLGEWIHDPDAVESAAGSTTGPGLLAMETTLLADKTLRNVSGIICDENHAETIAVNGYEIHAGISTGEALSRPVFSLTDKQSQETFMDGARNEDNTVIGSYVHGLFDNTAFLHHIIQWAGGQTDTYYDYQQFREQEINRLADAVETVLPIETLLALLSTN